MSDEESSNQSKAIYEPGTLDHTRKNIGEIDKEEAARMTKILGGKIYTEKSVPIDYSKLPKRAVSRRQVAVGATSVSSGRSPVESSSKSATQSSAKKPKSRTRGPLSNMAPKDVQILDRLMMSPEYDIKKNYGMFNFIRYLQKDGVEKVIPEFASITLKNHLEHIEEFITVIKQIIQLSPDTYKAKIQNDTGMKFRFLRKIATWSIRDIKLAFVPLDECEEAPLVADLIPFVRAVYKQLITIYYLGENGVSSIIKDIFNDLTKYPKVDKEKISQQAKEALTQWLYIYTQIVKGLYPLLNRMSGSHFEPYVLFFKDQLSEILAFVGLKKFDLLLPGQDTANKEKEVEVEKEKKEVKQAAPVDPHRKDDVVLTGLKLLDQLFPGAGFLTIEKMPDLFAYFDSMYEFADGLELVSPDNPVQVIVILCRILEDLFLGGHNIKFNIAENPMFATKDDSISEAMLEWPIYREDLFDKNYANPLKTLVNQTYTQSNFPTTQIGKKVINTLYWETKYSFLPQFTFERLLLERPINENKVISLASRTAFFRKVFTTLSKQIAVAEKTSAPIKGFPNPWEKYKFDLPTPVSKRLDVILHAKTKGPKVTATNANLVKYITCVVSVLDWWINSKESPAYRADPRKMYRVSEKDGTPIFSVQLIKNQDQLFMDNIKKAFARNAGKPEQAN